MRKTLALLVLATATLSLHAQPPASDTSALKQQVADLQDQVAERDIVIANLRMMLLQNQASPVASQRNDAVKSLEARHPGMHWDDAQQKLLPTPAPAAAPKPAAKK